MTNAHFSGDTSSTLTGTTTEGYLTSAFPSFHCLCAHLVFPWLLPNKWPQERALCALGKRLATKLTYVVLHHNKNSSEESLLKTLSETRH